MGHSLRAGRRNEAKQSVPAQATETTSKSGSLASHKSRVGADAGVVIDISGLGKSNDGVNKDIGLALAGSADGELAVGAMPGRCQEIYKSVGAEGKNFQSRRNNVHGIAGLERDNLPPGELSELGTELGRGIYINRGQSRAFQRRTQ